MPKTGTPASNRAGSTCGAPDSYTLDGPPDRMIAAGRLASSCSTGMECGTSSEYTLASRTRRAMSWAYWAPKSTTRTGSGVVMVESLRAQRGRSPCGHGRANRCDRRHHLVRRAEVRARVGLALVGPERHRALGL